MRYTFELPLLEHFLMGQHSVFFFHLKGAILKCFAQAPFSTFSWKHFSLKFHMLIFWILKTKIQRFAVLIVTLFSVFQYVTLKQSVWFCCLWHCWSPCVSMSCSASDKETLCAKVCLYVMWILSASNFAIKKSQAIHSKPLSCKTQSIK